MTARVLVVDDLRPNVKLLEAKLSSEYFDVLTAFDGASALEVVKHQLPDIVLLDVMMPGMDGFQVCREIKSNPKTMHIPVVMVTALSDSADRVKGLEAGADDFLTKPVNDTAMFARIRSLVRLKMLTDEWRLREETSGQLGVLRNEGTITEVDATLAHVLVVSDNQIEVARIKETLERDRDDIIASTTVGEAEDALRRSDFDMIVIDLRLRSDDALRYCSKLRAQDDTRYIPILMIAEEDDTKPLAKALDLGINDYLIKPIDRNELLARARTQIRRRRYQDRLRNTYEASLTMALIDSLTGLYNRRYLMAHLGGLIEKYVERKKELAVLMFDIDHFKDINDTYGHAAGDDVLIELSKRVVGNLRSMDMVARLGGEEFVVVMPDTDGETAKMVAERLRRLVGENSFEAKAAGKALNVSISIGATIFKPGADSVESLLRRVDEALYEAKRGGRDRVVCDFD